MAGRQGITSAQLAMAAPYPIKYYVQNPAYWMEEKFDGCRLLVLCTPEGTVQYNRMGQETTQNRVLSNVTAPMSVMFDGELMNDTYRVFDLLSLGDTPLVNLTLRVRREYLEQVVTSLAHPRIQATTVARTEEEKRALYLELVENHREGAMFKDVSSIYEPRRGRTWLKWKFYGTIDVIISELPYQGKAESAKIVIHRGDRLLVMGSVKIPMRYQKEQQIMVGDVIEVRYLNITADLKLYQPVFLRVRRDKQPSECILTEGPDSRAGLPYYHGGYDEGI